MICRIRGPGDTNSGGSTPSGPGASGIFLFFDFLSWGPPAFFDLSVLSNASIQSAGDWVTASSLLATSDEDGVGGASGINVPPQEESPK